MNTADYNQYRINTPKYSDWVVEVFPGTYFTILEGKVPNYFQRKMQELFFGVKWRKRPSKL